ncbi:hypothetical protein AMJ71_06070 [candidate division TA06 bacterium SM1_40]|uniref:ANTAR domain-containing protein n=2 Tax=Bacteria division TA06 TaxID=1156500 RepID=A0A0S8JLL0_UNCT6|nr:MAG: hypothetical protein AMJ82_12225 [candidate division TA06 bacterium SM23_40]KPL09531.1 MAG: hypothetical protein AMJ71_06070 [candidate division TA06 bacterium SM1_40]
MALTDEQREAITSLLGGINEEANRILAERDTVYAVMRIDGVAPDSLTDAMQLIQQARQRAAAAASALADLLNP